MSEALPAAEDLLDTRPLLTAEERLEAFHTLARGETDDFFPGLSTLDQAATLSCMPASGRRLWLRLLAPDDTADVLQCVSA